ncbi:MAG: carbohydrate kinase [Gammaproteobacteria bacterium]
MTAELPTQPLIFGEVLFDQFEDGSSVLGGAPFNVAWHLQAFGMQPLFMSRVGDDSYGRRIRDEMQHWGMSTAGLQKDSTYPTGLVSITIKNDEPSFDILADRAYDHISADALPPLNPSLIYHGSLAVRHPNSAAALAAIKQRYAVPVFIDVNLRPPWWQQAILKTLLQQASWAKLNNNEIDILIEGNAAPDQKAHELLQRFKVETVILTLGAEGAMALTRNGEHSQITPSQTLNIVDTVGAGDAFSSICILGHLKQWPIAIILERAQAFASAIVQIRGATINNQDFYQPFIDNWQWGKP